MAATQGAWTEDEKMANLEGREGREKKKKKKKNGTASVGGAWRLEGGEIQGKGPRRGVAKKERKDAAGESIRRKKS